MRRVIGTLLLCMVVFSGFAEMPYRTILRKANDHFVNEEWPEAIAMYDLLLDRQAKHIPTYVDAVVASGMVEDSTLIMRYVVQSQRQGLSLDSLFTGIDARSRAIGQSAIYERVLLLVKREQPWFTRVANNYLLGYYSFRHNADKSLVIADELLAVLPRQIDYLKAKANALLWQGNDSLAAEVHKQILGIDSLNVDANLFLGGFYAMKGKLKLQEVDASYLEDARQKEVSPTLYKIAKQQILQEEIAWAKAYWKRAMLSFGNQYLANQIWDLSTLTDALPKPGSESLLKRSKIE